VKQYSGELTDIETFLLLTDVFFLAYTVDDGKGGVVHVNVCDFSFWRDRC
jgi:hypothetical protein